MRPAPAGRTRMGPGNLGNSTCWRYQALPKLPTWQGGGEGGTGGRVRSGNKGGTRRCKVSCAGRGPVRSPPSAPLTRCLYLRRPGYPNAGSISPCVYTLTPGGAAGRGSRVGSSSNRVSGAAGCREQQQGARGPAAAAASLGAPAPPAAPPGPPHPCPPSAPAAGAGPVGVRAGRAGEGVVGSVGRAAGALGRRLHGASLPCKPQPRSGAPRPAPARPAPSALASRSWPLTRMALPFLGSRRTGVGSGWPKRPVWPPSSIAMAFRLVSPTFSTMPSTCWGGARGRRAGEQAAGRGMRGRGSALARRPGAPPPATQPFGRHCPRPPQQGARC